MPNLALRFRPDTLDEVTGQPALTAPDSVLRRMIETDNLSCLIFYGPPGTGKTTLANVIAKASNADFRQVNATSGSKSDMQKVVTDAQKNKEKGIKTILFIDEIHRFNKAQQDYLLPFTEDGTIILIGATTENPHCEINKAVLSRSMLFELKPINDTDMNRLLLNALYDKNKGLGNENATIQSEALSLLIASACGDARKGLMLLETASDLTTPDKNGKKTITEDIIKQAATSSNLKYDKTGNEHYDTISAFIKSMRGSDPDATLYYLARMLESGEDINYIARRIVIHASEDVGLADDSVLPIAVAAMTAVHNIGMPEAQIILAHAALRIALAPKSNTAVTGIGKACQYVQATGSLPIPLQASDNHVRVTNYIYPHDYEGHYVLQQYLPDQTAKAYKSFYNPCAANGHETELYERLQNIKNMHINALNGVNPT